MAERNMVLDFCVVADAVVAVLPEGFDDLTAQLERLKYDAAYKAPEAFGDIWWGFNAAVEGQVMGTPHWPAVKAAHAEALRGLGLG